MTIRLVMSTGFALFAMLFGAGNIIFPLVLGAHSGDKVLYALAGFAISGLCIPLIGVIAALMYQGDYEKLLSHLGRVPSSALIALCMMLIGPFGCIPRCMSIAHSAVSWHIPSLPLLLFSALAAGVVYVCAAQRGALVNVLGSVLGPIKLTLLLGLVVIGGVNAGKMPAVDLAKSTLFLQGLFDGYGTMDLLGALFFAGILARGLKGKYQQISRRDFMLMTVVIGVIGIVLLGIVYGGFFFVSAAYAGQLVHLERGQLLSGLATLVLGQYGGMVANITISLSCLTTAIALTSVFSDYIRGLSGNRLSYKTCVAGTVLIATCMTTLGFQKIMELIYPLIGMCYPILLIVACAGLLHKVIGVVVPRHSMYAAFMLLMLMKLF